MFKKILLIGTVAVCLIIGGLLLVDAEHYAALVTGPLQRSAQQAGINLSMEKSRLTLGAFSAERVGASFPIGFFPILLNLEQLEIRPRWMNILTLKPAFDIRGTLYKGSITGEIFMDGIGGSGTWRAVVKGIDLGTHPQIRGIGITAGTLELIANGVKFNGSGISSGTWELVLGGLEMAQAKVIPPALSGAPLDIPIPAFFKTNLNVKSNVRSPRLADFEVAFNSSLGEASGKGTLQGIAGAQVVAFDLGASLTEEGRTGLGSYLFIASNGALESTTEKFSFSLSGPLRRPRYTFKKLP